MEQQVDTNKIILKTKQYEFADGLRDIQLGLTMIIMGVFWIGIIYSPWFLRILISLGEDNDNWTGKALAWLILILPVLAIWGMEPVMRYIRRRWLWRESGMVKPHKMFVPIWVNVISSVILISVLVLGLLLQSALQTGEFYIWSVMLLGMGWGFGYTLVAMGKRIQINRYVQIGGFGGIASTFIMFYQSSLTGSGMVFMLGWGVVLVASGSIILRQVWPEVKGEAFV